MVDRQEYIEQLDAAIRRWASAQGGRVAVAVIGPITSDDDPNVGAIWRSGEREARMIWTADRAGNPGVSVLLFNARAQISPDGNATNSLEFPAVNSLGKRIADFLRDGIPD